VRTPAVHIRAVFLCHEYAEGIDVNAVMPVLIAVQVLTSARLNIKAVNHVAKLKNKKHETFAQEYMIDLIATQAAIRAGYSSNSAGELGYQLLQKPSIRARIDELLAERSRRTGVNADRVVRELARVAFVNAPDVIDTLAATVRDDAALDDTAVIQSVKVKTVVGDNMTSVEREIRLADKIKALELLGKHLGMYTGNTQNSDGGVLPALLEYLKDGNKSTD